MKRRFLNSKIHKATVTDSRIDYEGSCEIDRILLESAGIEPYEQIDIYNSLAQINLDSVRFSKWEGSIFAENIHRDQFSIHKRGDNRNIISVFTGNKDYEVKLDGDNTQIVSGDLSSKIINTEILNKINWERIKYLKAD